MWQERNERGVEGEPNCAECRVELLPENEDATFIFNIVRKQFIMSGMGAPVDINQLAIHEAMRLYRDRVRDPQDCFERVLILCDWLIRKINKKSEE